MPTPLVLSPDLRPPTSDLSTPCRLIIDPPAPGPWNMAVDEALLAAGEDVVTLRLYQWSEPTLSLGYFQRYADRDQHVASRSAAVVRRPSGGGAILHDRELTYSLTIPAAHPWARDTGALYYTVHRAIAALLVRLLGPRGAGWALELREAGSGLPASQEPFLCFQRRAPGDVCVAARAGPANEPAYKIIGSAQRRRGAVLQHGSVLLNTSPAAPELLGLCDVTGADLSLKELALELPSTILGLLGLGARRSALPPEVQLAAAKLSSEKYSSRRWTERH
jgi:lipoate-protein ligase A